MRLKAAYETSTFVNGNGYYAIRQDDQSGQESIIELKPAQMRALFRNMRHYISTSAEWFVDVESE